MSAGITMADIDAADALLGTMQVGAGEKRKRDEAHAALKSARTLYARADVGRDALLTTLGTALVDLAGAHWSVATIARLMRTNTVYWHLFSSKQFWRVLLRRDFPMSARDFQLIRARVKTLARVPGSKFTRSHPKLVYEWLFANETRLIENIAAPPAPSIASYDETPPTRTTAAVVDVGGRAVLALLRREPASLVALVDPSNGHTLDILDAARATLPCRAHFGALDARGPLLAACATTRSRSETATLIVWDDIDAAAPTHVALPPHFAGADTVRILDAATLIVGARTAVAVVRRDATWRVADVREKTAGMVERISETAYVEIRNEFDNAHVVINNVGTTNAVEAAVTLALGWKMTAVVPMDARSFVVVVTNEAASGVVLVRRNAGDGAWSASAVELLPEDGQSYFSHTSIVPLGRARILVHLFDGETERRSAYFASILILGGVPNIVRTADFLWHDVFSQKTSVFVSEGATTIVATAVRVGAAPVFAPRGFVLGNSIPWEVARMALISADGASAYCARESTVARVVFSGCDVERTTQTIAATHIALTPDGRIVTANAPPDGSQTPMRVALGVDMPARLVGEAQCVVAGRFSTTLLAPSERDGVLVTATTGDQRKMRLTGFALDAQAQTQLPYVDVESTQGLAVAGVADRFVVLHDAEMLYVFDVGAGRARAAATLSVGASNAGASAITLDRCLVLDDSRIAVVYMINDTEASHVGVLRLSDTATHVRIEQITELPTASDASVLYSLFKNRFIVHARGEIVLCTRYEPALNVRDDAVEEDEWRGWRYPGAVSEDTMGTVGAISRDMSRFLVHGTFPHVETRALVSSEAPSA
jgi:hypothetical protein